MTSCAQPFQTLLSRYLSNDIDHRTWSRFSAVCDLPTIFADERLAFASFVVDSIDNDENLYLPRSCEAEILMNEVRVDDIGSTAVGF